MQLVELECLSHLSLLRPIPQVLGLATKGVHIFHHELFESRATVASSIFVIISCIVIVAHLIVEVVQIEHSGFVVVPRGLSSAAAPAPASGSDSSASIPLRLLEDLLQLLHLELLALLAPLASADRCSCILALLGRRTVGNRFYNVLEEAHHIVLVQGFRIRCIVVAGSRPRSLVSPVTDVAYCGSFLDLFHRWRSPLLLLWVREVRRAAALSIFADSAWSCIVELGWPQENILVV